MDTTEKYIFHSFLITSVGLGVFITLFVVSLARYLRRNIELARANVMAGIKASEHERSRIAADLHDELAPALCAIKLMVTTFEFEDEEPKELQQKTDQQLEILMQRIRGISHDLMPSDLIERGLHAGLKSALHYIETAANIQITTSFDENIQYTDDQTLHLYRIINEIIHNTIKHAGATQIDITLRKTDRKIHLTIMENGVGFNFEDMASSGSGHGLKSLIGRTKLLKGTLDVRQRETGMKYTVVIPIQKKEPDQSMLKKNPPQEFEEEFP